MIKRFGSAILIGILVVLAFSPVSFAAAHESKFIHVKTVLNKVIALKEDGTLWEWYYPNGNSFDVKSIKFKQISGISSVKAFDATADAVVVLKKDGTVWAWGKNGYGLMGDGTFTNRSKPVKVKNITGIKELDVAGNHAIALKSDGTVWVWGDAGYNTSSLNGYINAPVKVKELSKVKSVTTGESFFAVLKNDGTVWTWGYSLNNYNYLGYSGQNGKPKAVPKLKNITAVSSGDQHTMALDKNGSVYVWGADAYKSKAKGYTSPCKISELKGVKRIFAGTGSFAISKDGTLRAWGSNELGQLGSGNIKTTDVPVKINKMESVNQVSSDYSHTIFLKNDGTLWLSGSKNGDKGYYIKKAEPVKNINNVADIAGSHQSSLALKKDGTVWEWGLKAKAEKGTDRFTALPGMVAGINDAIDVEAGEAFNCILRKDGTVWAWGQNYSGMLGDSTVAGQTKPAKVPELTNIKEIAANADYTLALSNDGKVWGFGRDAIGDIIPTDENISQPKPIEELQNIQKIDAGYTIATAIDNNGVLWAWKYSGQTKASAVIDAPRKIENIGEVQSIANGAVLTKDGSLYILNTSYKTIKIGELKNLKAIYRNSFSSIYALGENNSLWVVNVAEIAFSTSKKYQNSITKADFSLNTKDISKIESRLVLMNNGTVLAFGDNTFGQAGNGDYGFFMIPTKIK